MIIRPVKVSDAEDINFMRRQPGVRENILGIASERVANSKAFIENLSKNNHMFVVEIEEKVVGVANLNVMANPRKNHIGEIGIMVNKDYQGRGIGRRLMEELIDLAQNWLMLRRIQLDVISDNEKAINLYESLGFKIEGEKIDAVKRNGSYANEYVMGLIVDN
jgi:putative acetyltransferase